MELTINNDSDKHVKIWVGATFISEIGEEFFRPSQDIEYELPPNKEVVISRLLSLPQGAMPGVYSMQANLWYGTKSDPDHSVKITGVLGNQHFIVKGNKTDKEERIDQSAGLIELK